MTNIGVPYAVRAGALALTFVVAFTSMHDLGFKPARGTVRGAVTGILRASLDHGFRNPPVRWVMLAGGTTSRPSTTSSPQRAQTATRTGGPG